MKWILVIVTGLLTIYIPSSKADECGGENNINGNNKADKSAPLHHIIEFGKRSKVEVKGCVKNNSKNSNPNTPGTVLGLHGLLHARSQQKNKLKATEGKNNISSLKNITFEKPKNEPGLKRTSDLHKLRLRAETIGMLHKIVEKYFPGGHLTVDQKIKALKILGKLIKLKKAGKNSDIKKLLGSLSLRNQNDAKTSTSDDSMLKDKEVKNEKNSENKDSPVQSESEGDIYANIANGPDVPKLPPSVSGKDPDHAHSNIMPVGFQPMGRPGEMTNTMTRPNDVSDEISGRDLPNDRISNYQAPLGNAQGSMGLGQVYQNGNNFVGNGMSLSRLPNMMDEQGYGRSRMPYPRRRFRGRSWLNNEARQRYYDDDDDEDEDEDDDDDEEEEEQGRARSYVNRHRFYDDDDDDDAADDDDDVMEYTRRFDRKDKIAKRPKKTKSKHGSNKHV